MPRFSDQPLRPPPEPAPIRLEISVEGAVATELTSADLQRYATIDQVDDFHCVTGWSFRNLNWRGVRLAEVLRDVLDDRTPPYAVATGADRQAAIFVADDLLGPDVLLATELDGAPLDARHGAPLRLVSPLQYGYKNVKHLTALDFRRHEPTSTIGKKEHLRARVALDERHSTLPNWSIRLPYRLSVIPTAIAAERGMRRRQPSGSTPTRSTMA